MTAAYVTPDEWRGWLRQHDITPGTLQELTVVPEALFDRDTGGSRDAVLMRCLHLVTDANGRPMVGEDGDVVRVTVWRPMRRLLPTQPAVSSAPNRGGQGGAGAHGGA